MSADSTHGYLSSKCLLFPLCDLDGVIIEAIDQVRPILRVNGLLIIIILKLSRAGQDGQSP